MLGLASGNSAPPQPAQQLCQDLPEQVFVGELAAAIEVLKEMVSEAYINEETSFQGPVFDSLNEILQIDTDKSLLVFDTDANLCIEVAGRQHGLKTKAGTGRAGRPAVVTVTDSLLHDIVLPHVKQFATDAAQVILAALSERFAPTELLTALSLAYPQHLDPNPYVYPLALDPKP